ncbi:MAG: serine/threonine-protein kinase [Myxococcota bacterium]
MQDVLSGSASDPYPETAALGSRTRGPELDAGLGTGSNLGRYLVLETVGHGGMGRVLRAYDPKLQREVALKVVRREALDADAHDRMLREARAMAQLSHPNVVAVHDVEESPFGLVLVMELVVGQTLRKWTKEKPRPWPEVVTQFRLAGLGLAAAHTQRLLHRDFKPSNVLLSGLGEVKVTDFGLAKLVSSTGTKHSDGLVPIPTNDSLDGTLTQADIVLGTPRYMAPEQHRREVLGPAVDQYALCVSLWEALVGKPPFRVKGFDALLEAKEEGAPPWPADAPSVPRPIVEAIRRGLAANPLERWPSIDALLDALSYDPARQRTRWLLALGGLASVVAVAGGVQSWAAERAEQCQGAQAQLREVWDQARKDEVRQAILGVGAGYAETAWNHAEVVLDGYADEWATMHADACEATTIRGEQSAAVMDLRMGCLYRAKVELSAVSSVLSNADADVVQKTHDLIDGLPELSRCADMEALSEEVEPPRPEEADAVDEVRVQLAASKAEREAGRFKRAQQELEVAKAMVTTLEYEPIRSEVSLEEGHVLDELSEHESAEQALGRAMRQAAAQGQRELLREAASMSIFVVGQQLKRPKEALRYRELAEGLAEGDPSAEAEVRSFVAMSLEGQGKYEEAELEHRRALAQREETKGPDDAAVASSRNNLANALYAQGKYEESEQVHRQNLAIRERVLGPDHPRVAKSRNNLGIVLQTQGKYEEAGVEHRKALEVWEKTLEPGHRDIITLRNNIAAGLFKQGKQQEAEDEFQTIVALIEEALGPEHPDVATTRNNLAVVMSAQGKIEEAIAEHRKILALREKQLGLEHPDVAVSCHHLARLLLKQGKAEEALPLAERAWTRRQQTDTPDAVRADTAFLLARAIWESSSGVQARARAMTLAERARAAYGRARGDKDPAVELVEKWIAERG